MTCVTLQDTTLSGTEQSQKDVSQCVCEVGADTAQTQRDDGIVAVWLGGGDGTLVCNGTERHFCQMRKF